MTELYLIAHKVRGNAAFDIAKQTPCPLCQWYENTTGEIVCGGAGEEPKYKQEDCVECDFLGYWWIIPTSGHRAYPFYNRALNDMELSGYPITYVSDLMPEMPSNIPDHYRHGPAPKVDIKALFKNSGWEPNPQAFIPRRL